MIEGWNSSLTIPCELLIPPNQVPDDFPIGDAVVVCTDGSGNAKTGIGSWAYVARYPDGDIYERSAAAADTTNNVMELRAIVEALRFVPAHTPIVIVSDSQYCILGATLYLPKWKANNWTKADGSEVKNQQLWLALDEVQSLDDRYVCYHHVRGHKGHPGNERADKLCTAAANAYYDSLIDSLHHT